MYAHAAVAADHAIASRAGLEILRAGGNAVDAAVAASFTLSVVRPYSCGIGGGGFMVVHQPANAKRAGVTTTIDYREVAPAAVDPGFFERPERARDEFASTHGGAAIATPGTVAGLLHALERFGTLPRVRVMEPAIRAAHEGFDADQHYVHSNQEVIDWIRADGARAPRFPLVWERFLLEGRVRVGDRIRVPEQGEVLARIADQGAGAFYEGEVARAMVDAAGARGGVLTLADLAGYRVVERDPLVAHFRGHTLLTMPPPSSGGIVLAQVLGMLEHRSADLELAIAAGAGSGAYAHLVIEACKHAFADRAAWLGDPAAVRIPLRALLSPANLLARANAIDLARTHEPGWYGTRGPLPDDAGTSHLCVVDESGGAVSCTETINLYFGSLVGVDRFGFCLNNEMDDFQARPGRANAFDLVHAEKNPPRAGMRPLSSMCPTIVARTGADGSPGGVRALAGGSGGPRIISGTLQALLNVLLFDASAAGALEGPRFHHQWKPNRVGLEPGLMGSPLRGELEAFGHEVEAREAVGAVQLIRRAGGAWQAASDPRKGGSPAGY